jgi:hypothetical protein
VANPGAPDSRPRLVKGGADAPAPGGARSERGRRPRLTWILAALLAAALGAAVLQTGRLDRVTAEAEALRAANQELEARIQGYEQQRALIRDAVADLASRVAALGEIVRPDAAASEAAPEPAPEAADEPAPELSLEPAR